MIEEQKKTLHIAGTDETKSIDLESRLSRGKEKVREHIKINQKQEAQFQAEKEHSLQLQIIHLREQLAEKGRLIEGVTDSHLRDKEKELHSLLQKVEGQLDETNQQVLKSLREAGFNIAFKHLEKFAEQVSNEDLNAIQLAQAEYEQLRQIQKEQQQPQILQSTTPPFFNKPN